MRSSNWTKLLGVPRYRRLGHAGISELRSPSSADGQRPAVCPSIVKPSLASSQTGDEGGHARASADKQVERIKPFNPRSSAEETPPSLLREGSPPRDVAPPRASQSSGSGSGIAGHVTTPASSHVSSPVRDHTTVPVAITTGNAGESSASHAVPSREPRAVDPKPPERSPLPPPPPPLPPPPPPPPPDGTNPTSVLTADGSASRPTPAATAVPNACVVASGNSATCTAEQNALQTRSVEAEPTPPTVPDPAELKRGKCEVC